MRHRIIVADDEPIIRDAVSGFLTGEPDFEVVASCGDGIEALEAILNEGPAAVFLDVQMPGLTGIEVVDALPAGGRPAVIFVTAYDQYAVKAFEMNAVDYLLKPFDGERLRATVDRLRERLRSPAPHHPGVEAAVRSLQQQPYAARVLPVTAGRVHVIAVEDVEWLEAADNYVRVHAAGRSGLLRETLSGLLSRLDPARFVRVHRSAAVNVQHIAELRPRTNGDHQIVLASGAVTTLSRTYSQQVLERLR